MRTLIVGGTSGLGGCLTERFIRDSDVFVIGRRQPKVEVADWMAIDLSDEPWQEIYEFIDEIKVNDPIDRLVFCAGYFEGSNIAGMHWTMIQEMFNVCLASAAVTLNGVLRRQESLSEFVAITSTSQWTPRPNEPIYSSAKAGLAQFANSVADGELVEKALVAAPAGMRTSFWSGVEREDLDQMNDPNWVADQIVENLADKYVYREIAILREPPRVELRQER